MLAAIILFFLAYSNASNNDDLILPEKKQTKHFTYPSNFFCTDTIVVRSGIGLIEIICKKNNSIKLKRLLNQNILFTHDDFGNFENILELDLHGNVLSTLPDGFEKMKNLYGLNLSFNKLNFIPSTIWKFEFLERLDLHLNFILVVTEKICNLKFLQYLDISDNLLKAVPEQLFDLNNLNYLDLSKNELYYVPNSIVQLKNLETLDLSANKLIYITDEIGQLSQLNYLNISENPIYMLPITLINLTNLEELHMSKTFVINLPQKIGNLKYLKVLDVSDNMLIDLPKSIGQLSTIEFFHLNDNNLCEIPDEIGKLTSLKGLYLQNNKIKDLPNTLMNLKDTIVAINLSLNLLRNIGEGTNFGAIELKEIFNEKFILNSFEKKQERIINENTTNEILTKAFIWNHCKLNEICPVFNKMNELNMIEIFNLWSHAPFMTHFSEIKTKLTKLLKDTNSRIFLTNLYGNIINYDSIDRIIEEIYNLHRVLSIDINSKDIKVLQISEEFKKLDLNVDEDKNKFENIWKSVISELLQKFEHGKLLESFIYYLYNPNESYEQWKLNDLYIQMSKNYLLSLIHQFNFEDLDNLSRILVMSPDKLISGLTNLYLKKTGQITKNQSLEDIIKILIGEEKKITFDLLFSCFNNKKDNHVLTYWRNKLKNYIGFQFDMQYCYHDLKNDKFKKSTLDGFNAFFEKFTPEWIVKRLVETIVNDNELLDIAIKRANTMEKSEELLEYNFLINNVVQEEFIVAMLYEMNLLVDKKN